MCPAPALLPNRRLGVTREASFEEVQEARNFLVEQYREHEPSRESIELALDAILEVRVQGRYSHAVQPRCGCAAGQRGRASAGPLSSMWQKNDVIAQQRRHGGPVGGSCAALSAGVHCNRRTEAVGVLPGRGAPGEAARAAAGGLPPAPLRTAWRGGGRRAAAEVRNYPSFVPQPPPTPSSSPRRAYGLLGAGVACTSLPCTSRNTRSATMGQQQLAQCCGGPPARSPLTSQQPPTRPRRSFSQPVAALPLPVRALGARNNPRKRRIHLPGPWHLGGLDGGRQRPHAAAGRRACLCRLEAVRQAQQAQPGCAWLAGWVGGMY